MVSSILKRRRLECHARALLYSGEKFGIGVSAVGLYKPDINDMDSQPSSITINGFGSINGAYGISINNANYLKTTNTVYLLTLN